MWFFLQIIVVAMYSIGFGLGIGNTSNNSISRKPEVYQNELRLPYGVNFKYNGLLNINLDRVWIITKIPLPKVTDIEFKDINFDPECPGLDQAMTGIEYMIGNKADRKLIETWNRIYPELQARCLNMKMRLDTLKVLHRELKNRIKGLIEEDLYDALPWLNKYEKATLGPRGTNSFLSRRKRAFPVVPIIGGLFTVATELISSYLSKKRDRAIRKSVDRMKTDMIVMKNKLRTLETDFTMYGEFALNSTETILELIERSNRDKGLEGLEKIIAGKDIEFLERSLKVGHTPAIYQQVMNNYFALVENRQIYLYEKLHEELKRLLQGIARLSTGRLPPEIFPHHQIQNIIEQVTKMIRDRNTNYKIALNNTNDYYDMKLVTFKVDPNTHALIVTFPILIRPIEETPLRMYEIETVHVPIPDENLETDSYTRVITEKPYIAVNNEYYIQLRIQELRMCKIIDYQYYCEELFLVKHMTRATCESALYFQMENTITESCDFEYFHNKTVVPSVLDGGNEIILANMKSKNKHLVCKQNNYLDTPLTLPDLAYVKVNRSILCNCRIEADLTYVLNSVSACTDQTQDIEPIEFSLNLGFHKYLEQIQDLVRDNNETFVEKLGLPLGIRTFRLDRIPRTSVEQIRYPFAVEEHKDEEGNEIGTLREFRDNIRKLKQRLNKKREEMDTDHWMTQETDHFPSSESHPLNFLNDWRVKVFNFTIAIVTLGFWIYLIIMACRLKKMHNILYTELFRQMFTLTDAKTIDHRKEVVCSSTVLTWIFTIITLLGILVFIYKQVKNKNLCKGIKWDNTSEITLIISNGTRYIPIKIKKLTGYAHLFKIRSDLGNEDFELQKHCLWDMIFTKWHNRGPFLFYKDTPVRLPNIIPVSILNKYRLRNMSEEQGLNYSVMIKQNNTWYTPTVIEPIFTPQVNQSDTSEDN